MKERYVGIFWGAVLILLGITYLVTGVKSFTIQDPRLGLAIFAPIAALFFTSYYLSGVRKWGWLFPACIFTGLSVMMLILIATHEQVDAIIALPVMVATGVPFLVGYYLNRTHWGLLIPAYIMFLLGILMAFVDHIPGEVFASAFMLGFALPFLVVFLINRAQKWALIPFAALAFTGLIPLLASSFREETLGWMITLLMGVPFLVVFLWSPRNWWALLPAGFFISIAAAVALSSGKLTGALSPSDVDWTGRVVAGILFLGWALTFFILWLRRAASPTGWALYPAGILLVLAVVAAALGQQGINYAWPVVLILGGGWMLYNTWVRKNA